MSKVDGLVFNPGPECSRPGCCDLSCVWPEDEPMPRVWEGDSA